MRLERSHPPLLRNTFTSCGAQSMPALIAAKASSSGTGVGFHVIIMSPCCNKDRVSRRE